MGNLVPILFSSVAAALLTATIGYFKDTYAMKTLVTRLEERLNGAVTRLEELFDSNYRFLLYRIETLETEVKNLKQN